MKLVVILLFAAVSQNIHEVISVDNTDLNVFNVDNFKIKLDNVLKYKLDKKQDDGPVGRIDIITILEEILNFVVEQVIITVVKYRRFRNEVEAFEIKVVENTTIALDNVILEKVKELNKKVTDELSSSEKKCVETNRKSIEKLAKTHKDDLKKCTQDILEKVQSAEDVIIREVKNLGKVANDFLTDFMKCLINPENTQNCIVNIVNDAILKTVDAIFEIIWKVAASQLVFPRAISDLEKCGVSQIDATVFEADAYVSECFTGSAIAHGVSYILIPLFVIVNFCI